jgi:hypothetical protein
MSVGLEYVSELRLPSGLLFAPPQLMYENGEPRRNDIEREKLKNLEKSLF